MAPFPLLSPLSSRRVRATIAIQDSGKSSRVLPSHQSRAVCQLKQQNIYAHTSSLRVDETRRTYHTSIEETVAYHVRYDRGVLCRSMSQLWLAFNRGNIKLILFNS